MAGGNVSPQLGPLFAAAGAKYGIPANVLAGIASVETNLGDNISTSSTGAQGLMQFEPSTAKSLGVNPYNARSAIFGAAKLLVQSGYHKNPRFAIGAYNGGAGNPQYGYADQVLSEANRLKGQTARFAGQGMPSMPSTKGPSAGVHSGGVGQIPQFKVTTKQGFDQQGYNAAMANSIAGNYLSGQGKDPYAAGAPNTGLSTASSANPLLASGALSTGTPNASDYMTAKTSLQQISGSQVAMHPNGQMQLANQAVSDAKNAGANQDTQKLLRMVKFVIGAQYSQANHDDINQNEFSVKAKGTDCSGLISWLMGPQGLGIWKGSLATPDIPSAPGLQAGKGQQITLYNNAQAGNAGHVFIQIGNQYFASEGGVGVHQLPASEVQGYLQHGSDGGTYQAFHPKGL